jgi:hypothetical protein
MALEGGCQNSRPRSGVRSLGGREHDEEFQPIRDVDELVVDAALDIDDVTGLDRVPSSPIRIRACPASTWWISSSACGD